MANYNLEEMLGKQEEMCNKCIHTPVCEKKGHMEFAVENFYAFIRTYHDIVDRDYIMCKYFMTGLTPK